MSYFILDIEADGPAPGLFSMVSFGAVKVVPKILELTDEKKKEMLESESTELSFYGKTAPITNAWIPEALAVSGFSREEHEKFDDPKEVMERFDVWIKKTSVGHPILASDNNGFDAAFINYYFHWLLGKNPFGYSSRRIGDIYCGKVGDSRARWKHLRKTSHSHHPVADSLGNAEALLEIEKMGVKFKFN